MQTTNRFLYRSLLANAFFSVVTGAALLVFAPTFAAELGALEPDLLRGLGVGLGVFAGFVAFSARCGLWRNALVIIVGDVLWVAGSAVILAWAHAAFTTKGIVLVTVVAAVVALCANLQWVGWRRSRSYSR